MASIDALKLGRGAGDRFSRHQFLGARQGRPRLRSRLARSRRTCCSTSTRRSALLLDKLDRDVGKGNYVVGLTSDHGVAPVPERVKAQGFDAGRIDTAAVGRAIDGVLARELGPRHLPDARASTTTSISTTAST